MLWLALAGAQVDQPEPQGAPEPMPPRKRGLVAWPLEARLLEGEILATGSAKEQARTLLADVEKDAAARGFRRIARKAAEARGA